MSRYITKTMVCMLLLAPLTVFGDEAKVPSCASEETCVNDPDCQCWCSQSCGYRNKQKDDNPIFYEEKEDKFGKRCYCKQWDYENYDANCVKGMNIPQEKGAK